MQMIQYKIVHNAHLSIPMNMNDDDNNEIIGGCMYALKI